MDLTVIEFEINERVAIVTMNNPPVNAMGDEFLVDFEKVLDHVKKSNESRAMLIRSSCPGVFSAGDDLTQLETIDDELIEKVPRAHALLNELEELPIPTVAAINGHALGGGLELALVCDFRFMGSESGFIGSPEVRLGMIPALGGTQRLPILLGKARAVELMFKGLQLTPEKAKEILLVNEVFQHSELEEKSFDYAVRLARQATRAIAHIKQSLNTGIRDGFSAGLAQEFESFKTNIFSHDAREGLMAFMEGRKPNFKGFDE